MIKNFYLTKIQKFDSFHYFFCCFVHKSSVERIEKLVETKIKIVFQTKFETDTSSNVLSQKRNSKQKKIAEFPKENSE